MKYQDGTAQQTSVQPMAESDRKLVKCLEPAPMNVSVASASVLPLLESHEDDLQRQQCSIHNIVMTKPETIR